jgi:glycosyltransferase involved in cell wall biosynthesis
MTTPLRIGVDARELLGDATGVGRYLGELLRRWTARPDADRRRFVLYAPEPLPQAFGETVAEPRILTGRHGTWWEQTHLRRAASRDQLDLFFAPAYTAPLGITVPLAVTIHDISFVAHPEWFRVGEGIRRRWLTGRAAASAAVIFTDSAFSRSELESHLHADPSRIHVIPPGVTARIPSDKRDRRREPIVLFVGSVFNRRRLPDVIAAFARATHDIPSARLVIVGDDRSWPRQDLGAVAEARGVRDRTELLSYISNDALADLYARASAFVFLSEYEGFGLTPLEALAAGVPPIVLDTPIAREVYGNAAIFVMRDDLAGTAQAIRRVLVDPASAAPVLGNAPPVLARYSWDTAASETLAHLERIAVR